MFSMERSSFLYIPLIQIMTRNESNFQSLAFRAFSYFSCLELHGFTPFHPKQIYHVICVFVYRGIGHDLPPPPQKKTKN